MSLSDDAGLDEYEQSARDRLSPILGPLRFVDRPGAAPEGWHDFEADLPDGRTAAIEVTSEVDPARRSQASEVRRRGISTFSLPGSTLRWLVGLASGTRVRPLTESVLGNLLHDLQVEGRQTAQDIGDYRDPFVARLRGLGIESVFAAKAKAGREGTVMVRPGTYGGLGWDSETIDSWLSELITSERGRNKLAKLRRANVTQRHLVIVLDPFSPAGMGIPLALTARDERGAAEYGMPSFVPPEPLTHMWLMSMVDAWDGLMWTLGDGWRVFEA
jgi:hypothetical protein